MKLALSSFEIIVKGANCSTIIHLDYYLQDFISISGYVRLISNVFLDFRLKTDTSALSLKVKLNYSYSLLLLYLLNCILIIFFQVFLAVSRVHLYVVS